MRGRFITIEGPDGAGKTTQIASLCSFLEEHGYRVVRTREPGGTPLGETLRGLLLNEKMDPMTEVLLFNAARAEHLAQVIRPALARGDIVVCDRYVDSSYAYQAYGRGLGDVVDQLQQLATKNTMPDYTLFFQISLAESQRRLLLRTEESNQFDREERQFRQDVYMGYQDCLRRFADRMHVIDAMNSVERVTSDIRQWVQNTLLPDLLKE